MTSSLTYLSRTFLLTAILVLAFVTSVAVADCNPPIFTSAPALSINKNHCSAYTFDFNATEGGNDHPADPVTFSTTVGTINPTTGQLSVPTIMTCGSTSVTVTATNSCDSTADHTFEITWTNSKPNLTMNLPSSGLVCPAGKQSSYDFNSVDADPCDAAYWTITASDAVVNPPTITGTGLFNWLTDSSEAGLTKSFAATITDQCGGADTVAFSVQVLDHVPQVLAIEKTHSGQLGSVEEVSITRKIGSAQIGSFDFLIAFNSLPLNFISAQPGDALNACGWEYFTYKYTPTSNSCGWNCVESLVRITAIADVNDIAGSPSCSQFGENAELVKLRFYVAIDPSFECYYLPVRFAWLDCGDNSTTNIAGDTSWISSRVFDFENADPFNDPNYEMTDTVCSPEISYGGACADCDDALPGVRDIYFQHGGVDLNCTELDFAGDVNLNGIPYEIADASLLAEYFTGGLGVFTKNMAAQVAQSDANNDSFVLTTGDLAYLLRVILGDALPFPKLHPFAVTAQVDALGGIVTIDSPDPIAAVHMTFNVPEEIFIDNYTQLQLNYAVRDGKLHVLLWPGIERFDASIPAGINEIIKVHGATLDSIEISDYHGNMMSSMLSRRALPTEFALAQNFPNPFNPVTRININLPELSNWSLDIFNVTGQVIESFTGNGIGIVGIDWDARSYPSGVYFYKVQVGSWTASKKMLLLK